ncbi:MAG: hypothetical protein M8353_12065, partial [ANME-2 cluster archaeon]|nr:hypothetical protein [ANME-2 cluster archaeon]
MIQIISAAAAYIAAYLTYLRFHRLSEDSASFGDAEKDEHPSSARKSFMKSTNETSSSTRVNVSTCATKKSTLQNSGDFHRDTSPQRARHRPRRPRSIHRKSSTSTSKPIQRLIIVKDTPSEAKVVNTRVLDPVENKTPVSIDMHRTPEKPTTPMEMTTPNDNDGVVAMDWTTEKPTTPMEMTTPNDNDGV